MRLIDADLLIDELEKMIRTPRSTMEIVRDIIPMVDEQPVAYDLDKVVEEIQTYESSEFVRRCYDENLIYKDAAIDIAKRGGIDGET
jgi:hypothetical protein